MPFPRSVVNVSFLKPLPQKVEAKMPIYRGRAELLPSRQICLVEKASLQPASSCSNSGLSSCCLTARVLPSQVQTSIGALMGQDRNAELCRSRRRGKKRVGLVI
jgi:hypothetical protein